MPQKYDVNEPILVLIRRGRKGRGFTICPVEDIANPAVCTDSKDMGEAIEELLNDESQPRVNVNDLLSAAKGEPTSSAEPEEVEEGEDDEDDEDEGDGDEGEGGIFDGVAGSEDPAGQLLINVLSGAMNQGRKMSSKRVRGRGRRKKKSKKSS